MALGLSEFRWYYGFLGAVMAITFASPAWRVFRHLHHGVTTAAMMTKYATRKTTFSTDSIVTFTFTDNRGREQTGSDTVYGNWNPPADNILRIRYLPEAPGESAVVEGNVKRLPVVLFCIGAGIVIVALLAEVHVRRRRKRTQYERQTGEDHGTTEFREDE